MKRIVYSIILILIICSGGCSKEEKVENDIKEEVISCHVTSEIKEGMSVTTDYEIRYKGDYVSKTIVTDKTEVLDDTERQNQRDMVNAINETYADVPYYKTEVTIEGNVVKNIMEIDYENISVEGLRRVYPPVKGYIKDGKVKKDDLIKVYEDQGIVCEY